MLAYVFLNQLLILHLVQIDLKFLLRLHLEEQILGTHELDVLVLPLQLLLFFDLFFLLLNLFCLSCNILQRAFPVESASLAYGGGVSLLTLLSARLSILAESRCCTTLQASKIA